MIQPFLGVYPSLDDSNFIADNATLIGDVSLGRNASVWFGVVIRADVNWIRIGEETNIQDNSVIHVTNGSGPTRLGRGVTVGHSVTLHGCTVEDNVLVGIGSVVLDEVVIGRDSIIGARSLLTPGTQVPPRSLVKGSPGRVVRELKDEEIATIRHYAEHYLRYSAIYLGREKPARNPFYSR